MKQIVLALLAAGSLSQAQPSGTLLRVTCTNSDGTKAVTPARVVYFNAEKGELFGIGFGPNRQDDGFKKFSGNCVVEPAAQNSPSGDE